MDNDWVTSRLAAWALDTVSPDARISDVRAMPGNSGFSFGFRLTAADVEQDLVVRLPPPGAKWNRSADVLHQARIMTAMHSAGIPVPEVRWSGDGRRWFGSPYYVVTWVRGRSTDLYGPDGLHEDGGELEPVFRSGMETLAAIHTYDWRTGLADWSAPVDLADEVAMWIPTLEKSLDDSWVRAGKEVAELLSATQPQPRSVAVMHGDYYSNNWLFKDGRITAVVDWEIAGIGSTGLDVGWVCMVYDPESWGPLRHTWSAWSPTPEFLVDAYRAAGGPAVDHLDWYRALAGYRLACITGRNYMLHSTGKRPDPAWDIMADTFPYLIARARDLLQRRAA